MLPSAAVAGEKPLAPKAAAAVAVSKRRIAVPSKKPEAEAKGPTPRQREHKQALKAKAKPPSVVSTALADKVREEMAKDPLAERGDFDEVVRQLTGKVTEKLPAGVAPARAVKELGPEMAAAVREHYRKKEEVTPEKKKAAEEEVTRQHERAAEEAEKRRRGKGAKGAAFLARDDETISRRAKEEMARHEDERDPILESLHEKYEARKKLRGGGKGGAKRQGQRDKITEEIEELKRKYAERLDEQAAEEEAAKPKEEPKPEPAPAVLEGETPESKAAADAMARTQKLAPVIGQAIAGVEEPRWDRVPGSKFKQTAMEHAQNLVEAVRAALAAAGEAMRDRVNIKLNSPEENLAIFARNELAKEKKTGRAEFTKYITGLLFLKGGDRAEFDQLMRSEQLEGTTGQEAISKGEAENVRGKARGAISASDEANIGSKGYYDLPLSPRPAVDENGDIDPDDFWRPPGERRDAVLTDRDGKPVAVRVHAVHSTSRLVEVVGKGARPLFRGGFHDLINRMHSKALKSLVGDVKVYFLSTEDITALRGQNVRGSYKHPTLVRRIGGAQPYIVINADLFATGTAAERQHTVLHEATHAATVQAYLDDVNGVKTLVDDMLRTLKGQLEVSGEWDQLTEQQRYGFKNGLEFIAQAFSDPRFQELLSSWTVPEKITQQMRGIPATVGRPKWWQAFVNAVSRAVGMFNVFAGRGATYMEHIVAIYPELVLSREEQRARDVAKVLEAMGEEPGHVALPKGMLDLPAFAGRVGQQWEEQRRNAGGWVGRAKRVLRTKGATTQQILRDSARWWGGPDNPLYRYGTAVLKTAQRLRNAARTGNDIINTMLAARNKHRADFDKGTNLLYDATVGEYNPMVSLADPTNKHISKKGDLDVHRRADHAKAHAEWQKVNPVVQKALKRWVEHMRSMEEQHVAKQVRNIVKDAEREFGLTFPAGESADTVIKWVLDGGIDKKEPADPKNIQANEQGPRDAALHAALGKTAKRLVDSKGMHHVRGVYVPLMRFGDRFFSATHRVEVPPGAILDPDVEEENVLIFDNKQDYLNYVRTAGDYDDRQIRGKPRKEHLDPATGENVGAKDIRGKEYWFVEIQNKIFETAESEVELEELRKEYEANGFKTSPVGLIESKLNNNSKLLPEQVRALLRNIEQSSASDSSKKANTGAVIDAYIRQLSGNRAAHRRLKRKGVKGFDRDFLKNSLTMNDVISSRVENLDIMPELAELENEVRDYLQRGHEREYATTEFEQIERQTQFNEIKQRVDKSRAVTAHWSHSAVKRVLDGAFIYRLFTPAYSVGNILGGMTTGTAVLAEKFGGPAALNAMIKAGSRLGGLKVLGKGVGLTGRELMNLVKTRPGGKVYSFHEDFIQPKFAVGTIERTFADELEARGLGVGSGLETAAVSELGAGIAGRYIERLMKAARAFPEAAETLNRYLTGFAALDLARQSGMSEELAIEYAINSVERSQGGYNVENNPAYFNHPALKIPLQFKKYSQMYAQLYYRALAGSLNFKGDPQMRKEAQRLFAYLTTFNVLLAGAFGQPVVEFAKVFAMLLAGEDWEETENWIQEMLGSVIGDRMSEISTRGLSRAAGIDLSNRLGNQSLFFFGSPDKMEADDIKSWLFDMMVGSSGGMITDTIKQVYDGDLIGALPLPKFIEDSIKAIGSAQKGPATEAGREYDRPLTIPEAAAKAAGFRPAVEARRFEAGGTSAEHFKRQASSRERTIEMQKYSNARPAERARIWRTDIAKYNRTHPKDMRIEYKDLRRSLQRHKQLEEEEKKRAKSQ